MKSPAAIRDWRVVELPLGTPVWEQVFTVAPLVLIGTKEGDGHDIAPKHLASPFGWGNWFGFVCTPRHATHRNIVEHGVFTVSFPRADRILHATLAAGERLEDGSKPALEAVPTFPARHVDGVLVEGCYLYLECELERIVDGLGENSLIVGRIVSSSARQEFVRRADDDDADLLQHLSPVVYLSPGRFGIVRETYSFPFPSGFSR